MPHNLPKVGLTAPGLGHHLDITGSPEGGHVATNTDGYPSVPLRLGALVNGRDAVLNVTDPDYLISLVDAALFAHQQLAIAYSDTARPGGVAA